MSIEKFLKNPTPSAESSYHLVDFMNAEVHTGIVNGTYFLTVSGELPCMNMNVELMPRIYLTCPGYWGIEVVGCLPNPYCLKAIKPYTLTVPLIGITGSKGIEVVGATKAQQFDLPGGCDDSIRISSDGLVPWKQAAIK